VPITFRELGESAQKARLRPVIAAIDGHLSRLSAASATGTGPATPPLLDSWAELVRLLDLGPAPEMRACPTCGRGGLRAATRCGFCWSALPSAPAPRSQGGDGMFDGG
jgi:hypothetical protein